ncbi:MAG: RNA polymerase factor sigma-54 [Candidatus Latescibacterota bacterium]|nr:RNA polymerase factor sigma-54 [Candidatus Latescibacterota bacterium]
MTTLRLSQSMSLQQRMAPQLIQSLQLLQMSTLELELEIKQQMELNPLLEESLALEEEGETTEDTGESEEDKEPQDELLAEEQELPAENDEVDWDALLEDQFDQNSYNNDASEFDPNWEQDREPQENRITTMPLLSEQLYEQLTVSDLEGDDIEIAEFIIGNIDDRGYLTCSTALIAEFFGKIEGEVESVLKVVQTFEPPGLGARDLRECLLIQLDLKIGEVDDDDRELAVQVVRNHMEDLTKRRFSRITRDLGIENDDLKGAMEVIEKLQPNPGSALTSNFDGLLTLDTDVPYVTPDLLVEKVGEDWVVSLTDGNLPSLRINAAYAKLMQNSKSKTGTAKAKEKAKGDGEMEGDKKEDVRGYVSKKINDARWLINAIQQRRTTMLKVANYLVRAQINWFEHGIVHLKPMVLQDVADAVGMHVSTISRVSNGKYIQTPYGVFEIKYFFDSKVSREDGEDVSARSVKEKISAMIEEEDKKKPLSDQEIAALLGRDGLQIARRTVAKYRVQLGINSQRYRKQVF